MSSQRKVATAVGEDGSGCCWGGRQWRLPLGIPWQLLVLRDTTVAAVGLWASCFLGEKERAQAVFAKKPEAPKVVRGRAYRQNVL
jgi:hypothetical protein